MEKVKTVAAQLRLEATASLKAEVQKELAVADPAEVVDLSKYGQCGTNCGCKEPNGD